VRRLQAEYDVRDDNGKKTRKLGCVIGHHGREEDPLLFTAFLGLHLPVLAAVATGFPIAIERPQLRGLVVITHALQPEL
jgi:hypothetical protein